MFTEFSTFSLIPQVSCENEFIGYVICDDCGNISFQRRSDYSTLFVSATSVMKYASQNVPPCSLGDFIYIGLESPHIDEFRISPIAFFGEQAKVLARPAAGKTGFQIDRNLIRKISPYIQFTPGLCYPVCLINVVQIQCSCGYKPEEYRDENFIKALFGSNQLHYQKYVNTVKSLHQGYFFNCCTRGSSSTIRKALKYLGVKNEPDELRLIVEKILTENAPQGVTVYRLNHPSSWWH